MTAIAIGRRAWLAAALALAACGRSTRGEPRATGAARRVVSMSPSTTEAIFAVGAGALLVGRSRYCDYPPEVARLPQVGGYVDPNLEAILALRPDLVVGGRGPSSSALADKLTARGIATYFPPSDTFADIDAMILGVGERTGHVDEARRAVDRVHARVAEVEAAVKPLPRVRALLVFGLEPIVAAGPGGFADEMLRRAGGDDVVTSGGAYPVLDVEHVLALDPDVVLNAAVAEAHGATRITKDAPGWRALRAVREGRVAAITDEAVLRPGPRVGDGLATIARALHPGLALR